ncbi:MULTISPECIES: PIN domain-containing protein [unclassified Clostridium]|uniref:PIN domain-containing protein n=1 Tax=unclassified Clostridium TaxID=2614128 RepID=UPI0002977FDF|nr:MULTISPECIES: PIN domain-containing protein [unclassified Clostridium]EKQ52393.1 MAG: hypothetical protein A370_04226 [Clostridium sp. Maddingley MBC34-26]
MINIFIDTNVYIKLLTNPEERNLFEELMTLVKEKVVNLLVPEIVTLELAKQNKTAKHNFENELNKLESSIKEYSKSLWSEVRDIEKKINSVIVEERKTKEIMWNKNYIALSEYLISKEVQYIEFTPEIMCKGEKRKISGDLVRPCENSSQDSYNIESLISYLNLLDNKEEMELIICSNDIKDFSKDKKGSNGFYELHPILQKDFPNTKCINTLERLMKYINYGYEYINQNDIDRTAIDELNAIADKIDENDYDVKYIECEKQYIENLKNVFNDKIKFTKNELQNYRALVISNINELLKKCRNTETWDNKSELKLYRWIKDRDEKFIDVSKLSDLILIRENIKDYLNIHLNKKQ